MIRQKTIATPQANHHQNKTAMPYCSKLIESVAYERPVVVVVANQTERVGEIKDGGARVINRTKRIDLKLVKVI